MKFEDKFCYDAKVGATATDGEEEVWVRCGAGGDDGAARCDDRCLDGLNVEMGTFREVGDIPVGGCRWLTHAFRSASRSLRPKSS